VNHDWDCYLCNVNGEKASIRLNLALRGEIPDPNRTWLLFVWLKFRFPRPDGLSDSREFESLSAIETRLTQNMVQKCDALLSGTITTQGRREFYFYGANPEQLESAVRETKELFRDHEFEWGSQEDSNWLQYLDVLYPSEEQMQCMQNRKVLESLTENGDPLTEPRDVMHWAYFKTPHGREDFRNEIVTLGYRVDSETEHPGDEYPQGICFLRNHSMDPLELDRTILELFRLASRFQGDYDGWETQVISSKP
jgi:regulator of RNase E activity RraB